MGKNKNKNKANKKAFVEYAMAESINTNLDMSEDVKEMDADMK